ncbi:unnamed protein product [Peronospora effusa]|nr:unnamed protein product [Peronospora effusa]
MLSDSEGRATLSAPTSAASTTERAASKETAAAQQQVGDSTSSASVNPMSDVLTIHKMNPKPLTVPDCRLSEGVLRCRVWTFFSPCVPVGLDEFPRQHGAIDPPKSINDVRQEPYNMPPGFVWSELDLSNAHETEEVYDLLTQSYVEDDDNMFRFDSLY